MHHFGVIIKLVTYLPAFPNGSNIVNDVFGIEINKCDIFGLYLAIIISKSSLSSELAIMRVYFVKSK